MEPKFADLRDGCLIRVIRPDAEHVAVMHVTRLPNPPRLGAIVQFGLPTATGDAWPPATRVCRCIGTRWRNCAESNARATRPCPSR